MVGGCGCPGCCETLPSGEELSGETGSATRSVGATGNQDIDGLVYGRAFTKTSFTYSFPTSANSYQADYAWYDSSPNSIQGFNNNQKAAARFALEQQYEKVANLNFTEASPGYTDFRLAESDNPGTAYAYYPTTAVVGGDSWYNKTSYNNPIKGNYAWHTILHELGHNLGLKHGHETGGFGAMTYDKDSMEYSVMTYRAYRGSPLTGYANETYGFAQTLMMYDIAAIQYMYGANFNTNSGDTEYTFSPTTGEMFVNGVGDGAPGGNRIFRTLWDGDGVDHYNFSNYTTNQTIDLTPGGHSTLSTAQIAKLRWDGSQVARGNLFNALQYNGDSRSLIEKATTGSGNDTVTGNIAANRLDGGSGVDYLYGGDGDDTLIGGSGADSLHGQAGVDRLDYSGSSAGVTIDLSSGVASGGDAQGDSFSGIEAVTGSSSADALRGNSGANTLNGGGGGDTLEGRGGADVLIGGAGVDTASYQSSAGPVTVDLSTGVGSRNDAAGDSLNGIENLTG